MLLTIGLCLMGLSVLLPIMAIKNHAYSGRRDMDHLVQYQMLKAKGERVTPDTPGVYFVLKRPWLYVGMFVAGSGLCLMDFIFLQ